MIQFAPESLSEETYLEPSTLEGPLIITFFVRRIKGVSGEIMVLFFFGFLSRVIVCLMVVVEKNRETVCSGELEFLINWSDMNFHTCWGSPRPLWAGSLAPTSGYLFKYSVAVRLKRSFSYLITKNMIELFCNLLFAIMWSFFYLTRLSMIFTNCLIYSLFSISLRCPYKLSRYSLNRSRLSVC